jgi:hypothetical protein
MDPQGRRAILSSAFDAALVHREIEVQIDTATISVDELKDRLLGRADELWRTVAPDEEIVDRARHRVAELQFQLTTSGPVPGLPRPKLLQSFGDAVKEADRAELALNQALLERSVLPQLREELEADRGRSYRTVLEVVSAPGLGQLSDVGREVETAAQTQLARLLGAVTTACIGVSGPRGAGKTTLLAALAEGRLAVDPSFRYRCLAAAPTRYDTREFLLHLTAQICHAVLAVDRRRPRFEQGSVRDRLALGAILLAPVALMSLGLALVLRQYVSTPLTLGLVLIVAGGAVWIVGRRFAMGFSRIELPVSVELISKTEPNDNLMDDHMRDWRDSSPLTAPRLGSMRWESILPSMLVVEGLFVAAVALLAEPFPVGLVVGVSLIAAASLFMVALARWLTIGGIEIKREGREQGWDESERAERASSLLDETRYQLTFSESLSANLSLDLKAVQIGGGMTTEVARQQLPLSLPEIVQQFRTFVSGISTSARTLVCIDELDKMATAEDAASFLNDVKTIFGIPNCCFVLSVSEDALATFERRGLPVRTALDSSLDDIVQVGYLDWKAARWLLVRRVAGVPVPFWALCYCLSGGLARDLVRSARHLFDVAEGRPSSLTTLCQELVCSDVKARANGQMAALQSIDDSSTDEIVRWLLEILEMLEPSSDEALRAHLGSFASVSRAHFEHQGALPSVASTLPFVSYLALAVTVRDVFINNRARDELEVAENGEDLRSFDRLAEARRRVTASPRTAWEMLVTSRAAWDLPPLPPPLPSWSKS